MILEIFVVNTFCFLFILYYLHNGYKDFETRLTAIIIQQDVVEDEKQIMQVKHMAICVTYFLAIPIAIIRLFGKLK
jgi:hypothetical protein